MSDETDIATIDPDKKIEDEKIDEEDQQKKLPYPKSVFFIVSNEFCERFSYYGMRTILILYLKNILLFSESDSKVIYHAFSMFVYFFPLLGAIISDSWLNKFRTIFYVSIIYAIGSILLAASSAPWGIPQVAFSMISLLLIALGTGGIKPCVAAFGGDQFKVPEQEAQLATFFSLYYFSINSGSLISTFLTPVIRERVKCFGNDTCYPLAFAIPGALMIVSIVIFGLGKPLYIIKKPEGNIIVKVFKCMTAGVRNKMKRDKTETPKEHWLDYAEGEYDKGLIEDIKATLKVLLLYIPLPVFWALYDQQGSGWTIQAVNMDGDIGFYTILPDQMQVVNPLLILAFIPLFTYVVYPLLNKCNFLTTPLQRMAGGGFLAAAAFAVSACISLWIESTYPVLPEDNGLHLRFYNPSTCDVTIAVDPFSFKETIKPNDYLHKTDFSLEGTKSIDFTATSDCYSKAQTGQFSLSGGSAYGILFAKEGIEHYLDNLEKSDDANPLIRTLTWDKVPISYSSNENSYNVPAGNRSQIPFSIGTYKANNLGEIKFKMGGNYVVLINNEVKSLQSVIVTEPNSVHVLWLLIQYFIMTAAEILYAITGLEFSYSQAPVSMKSVLQACWLLTTAFGNLLIIIIESGAHFSKTSYDFFFYAGLMVVDIFLFALLARRYKYVEIQGSESDETELSEKPSIDNEKNGIDNPSYN